MTVAALAGRRIDAADSDSASFPPAHVNRVRSDIRRTFQDENVHLLICSAAAGADLLALQVAQQLRVECRVVLPFEKDRFRLTSVVDRSDAWGSLYDAVISNLEHSKRLKVIEPVKDDDEAYRRATKVIVEEAIAAAFPDKPLAIVVWDNNVRSSDDFTNQFKLLAYETGMRERVILTR